MMTSNNPLVERYKRYRNAGRKLNHRIIDALLTRDDLKAAGDALGVRKKNRLMLESEAEMDVVMDFALYEVPSDGRNLVTRYADERGGSSKTERDLLAAMRATRSGLFRITAVHPTICQLELADLIESERILKLTDIALSQSIEGEIIFFFRPLELAEFTMTSGIGFPFPARMKKELLDVWRKRGPAERYAKYFELSHRSGISMNYLPT